MSHQLGFFDLEDRYGALSSFGDPLEKLGAVVHFEAFRYRLEKALKRSARTKGGRPPFDSVLMFKVLVLQALYNLSDEGAEFHIRDRLTFMRFLDLGVSEKGPDAKTIWLFREHLTQAGALEKLFALFDERLRESGYLAKSGQIVDATLIAAPRQHNTDDEKQALKEGRIPEDWQDHPAKLAQKDRDARWTVKFSKGKAREDGAKQTDIAIPVFGYKNHISIDARHGFIRRYKVTDAAASDGARLREGLIDPNNTASSVWADTAYRSQANEGYLADHGKVSRIHHKKPKGKTMPPAVARSNAVKSKVRVHVEHVFARQKGPMALFVRTIGIARATFKIGMANLAYNMKRLVFWQGKLTPA